MLLGAELLLLAELLCSLLLRSKLLLLLALLLLGQQAHEHLLQQLLLALLVLGHHEQELRKLSGLVFEDRDARHSPRHVCLTLPGVCCARSSAAARSTPWLSLPESSLLPSTPRDHPRTS